MHPVESVKEIRLISDLANKVFLVADELKWRR